jgi:predicted amidophosphoribosyltransferase
LKTGAALNIYGFDYFKPFFLYRDEIRELLISFKFKKNYNLKYLFADILESELLKWQQKGYTIFNAPGSGQNGSFPVLIDELRRRGLSINSCFKKLNKTEQKKLSRAERLTAVKGKIKIGNLRLPPNIVIIDDILTTGATLTECCSVARAKGARNITVLVLALDLLS